jgi:signal transduction histidine kinase
VLGRLRVRGKLALVVAVPLLAVALLTIPSVVGAMDRAQRANDIGDTMYVANRVTSLVSELRQERLLSLGYLFEVADRSRLVTQSTRVSDRIVDIRQGALDGSDDGGPLPGPVAGALDQVIALAELRESVLDRAATPELVMGEFGAAIRTLIDSLRLLDGVDLANPAVRSVAALDASLRTNELASQTTDLRLVVAATGSQPAVAQYVATARQLEDHLARFIQYATPEQIALQELMQGAFNARSQTLGIGESPGTNPISPPSMFPSLESLGQLGRFVETKVITDVLIEVEAQAGAELRTAYLVVFGALLVVLTVVVLTATLAQAVVRPLLGLTRSAHRVAGLADAELARIADEEDADHELPEPVRLDPAHVQARDEIGDLGRAFDRVQSTAVQLVERQVVSRRNVALMFSYLGRRTHNLVGRQLALIDQLEQNETDPDRLADLYRLDHIASRLRRNAGSLVVLSGSTGADEHTAPLPLADLVRLALGEIEDYDRVDVEVPATIRLAPAVVADLVLVLAELMENATSFSPPHTRVSVSAVRSGYGAEVSVVDRGLGMSPERLAAENLRLARRERLDLAPTEVLGLFVVGRLARRHGLRVTLAPTPGGGVTAVVGIDRRLLVQTEPTPMRAIATASLPSDRGSPSQDLVWAAGPDRLGSAPFDLTALTRASQTLASARRWNAFEVPTEPVPPAPPEQPPPEQPPPAPDETPSPEPRAAGLRRRVPGATLDGAATRPAAAAPAPVRPTPADPDQARQVVEQLESGVARALSEIHTEKEHHDR